MSLIVNGNSVETRGLETFSWVDPSTNPKLLIPQVKKGRKQTPEKVKAAMVHTIFGKVNPAQKTLADLVKVSPSSVQAERMAIRQTVGDREVSWHFTVDRDGTVVQSADPALWMCWHASAANSWSFGIEMVQDEDGTQYLQCIEATATLIEICCDELNIPKIFPATELGTPLETFHSRYSGKNGKAWAGVLGHRNQTTNRGKGDPGNHIFHALMKRGFLPARE